MTATPRMPTGMLIPKMPKIRRNQTAEVGKDPIIFSGTYQTDLNLIELNSAIINQIKKDIEEKTKSIQTQISTLKESIQQPQKLLTRRSALNKIEVLEKELATVESQSRLLGYQAAVEPWLEEYRKIGPEVKVMIFGKSTPRPTEEEPTMALHRQKIIAQFLSAAQPFISLDIVQDVSTSRNCEVCQMVFEDMVPDDNGILHCNCGIERSSLQGETMTLGIAKSSTNRNEYDPKSNFENLLRRKQCKQENLIDPKVFEDLDNYFANYKLPTSAQIKAQPCLPDRTKAGTSLEMILKALSDTGHVIYYDDVDLLCHLYWGWEPLNVEMYQDRIMADHDAVENMYQTLITEQKLERKSAINTQYKLFQILRRYVPCKVEDFKMIKTPEILEFYDTICAQIWERLGWTGFVRLI